MKMELLTTCPVCKSDQHAPYLTCQDYTVSQEPFTISECQSCGFVFTNPRPTEAAISAYYQSTDYISHSNTKQGLIARAYHSVRKITLQNKLNLINRLVPTRGKLLDMGCGTGMFLSVCKENGWTVAGTEPDPGARALAEQHTKQSIQTGIQNSFQNETFQIITLWHVLEHIHQVNETIDWLYEHLSPVGYLIIAVPNLKSYDAQVYGKFWAAYDVPRHLYHFSQQTISQLFRAHQFQLVETLPMVFDSYYVSMLSTKYKSGTINYFDAVKTGFQSNQWAKKHQNNYSSLIYVFKKS